MPKLTEEIVRQRLRNYSAPMELITNINITGRDLDDISLVRQMTSIEILSLSVNKIGTLYDLQFCTSLKELYLRKNNITDLNEIYYLTELPNLTVLGLSQNPCSNDPDYRITIIKNLTKLEKLDDIQITPEERVVAFRKGRKVKHLLDEEADAILKCKAAGMVEDSKRPDDREPTESSRLLNGPGKPSSSGGYRTDFRQGEYPSPDKTDRDSKDLKDSPNLISGIMTLIKDLDYQNLEILSHNIKGRLSELQKSSGY